MEVIVCHLPSCDEFKLNIYLDIILSSRDPDDENFRLDSANKLCSFVYKNRIDYAQLENELRIRPFVGCYAHIGNISELPDGIKCSGLILSFAPSATESVSQSSCASSFKEPVATSASEDSSKALVRVGKEQPFWIESTCGKIAFLARFSDLYNTINRTYGIKVDYRMNCISAPRAPVDELERLSQENSMLREMPVDELIEIDDYDCIEELFDEELQARAKSEQLRAMLHRSSDSSISLIFSLDCDKNETEDILGKCLTKKSGQPLISERREIRLREWGTSDEESQSASNQQQSAENVAHVSDDEPTMFVTRTAGNKEQGRPSKHRQHNTMSSKHYGYGQSDKAIVQHHIPFASADELSVIWDAYAMEIGGFKNIISRTDSAIVLSGSAEDLTTVISTVDTWLQKLERRDIADIDNEPGLVTFLDSAAGKEFFASLGWDSKKNHKRRYCHVSILHRPLPAKHNDAERFSAAVPNLGHNAWNSAKKKVRALHKFKLSSRNSKYKQRHADASRSARASQSMQPQLVPDMDEILFQFNNVTLSLEQGSLHNFMADVLVCTVTGGGRGRRQDGGRTLAQQGTLGASFSDAGGYALEQSFQQCEDMRPGCVMLVNAPQGFSCCIIMFYSIRTWQPGKTHRYLVDGLRKCITQAEAANCTSIAFPAVGTGHLKYPTDEVAACFWKVGKSKAAGSIKQVYLVANSNNTHAMFKKEFQRLKQSKHRRPQRPSPLPSPLQNSFHSDSADRFHDSDCSEDDNSDQHEETEDKSVDNENLLAAGTLFYADSDSNVQGNDNTSSHGTHNELVFRIVAVDKRTCDQVESSLKSKLCELFVIDKIKSAFIQSMKDGDLLALKTAGCQLNEVEITIDKLRGEITIRGHKDTVSKARERLIKQLAEQESQLVKQATVKRDSTKPTCLLDRIRRMDVVVPSTWSSQSGKLISEVTPFCKIFSCPSSSPEFKAVVRLVVETWRVNLVGQGSDASGLKHSNLRVTKVERVENSERFKAYMSYRQMICSRLFGTGYKRYVSIKDVDTNGSEGEVLTSRIRAQELDWIDEASGDDPHVRHSPLAAINEVLLFHGTKPDVVDGVVSQGLDSRLGGKGLFGSGIYLAESSTKADQYADSKSSRQPGDKHMFIVRTILGQPHACDNPHTFKRPPCVRAPQSCRNLDRCTIHDQCDSVIGLSKSAGNRLLFREFVVYDSHQCYPLYKVTYQRV